MGPDTEGVVESLAKVLEQPIARVKKRYDARCEGTRSPALRHFSLRGDDTLATEREKATPNTQDTNEPNEAMRTEPGQPYPVLAVCVRGLLLCIAERTCLGRARTVSPTKHRPLKWPWRAIETSSVADVICTIVGGMAVIASIPGHARLR